MRFAHYAVNTLAAALILAACGSGATPVATVSTSVLIVTPPAPTVAATPQPANAPNGNVLPTPLYAITSGQIVRIERDGATVTPISHEPSDAGLRAVVSMAVLPKDNALAYLVQKPGSGIALIRSDAEGQNRAILLDNLAAGTASSPLWSPDGGAIVIAVSGGDSTATIGDGIYMVPSGGVGASEPKRCIRLSNQGLAPNLIPIRLATRQSHSRLTAASCSFHAMGKSACV